MRSARSQDDGARRTASPATTAAALAARAVVLASGGAAALWSRTTNPPGSFGSGLLLARAAGAELADLEFVQFHPTAVVGIQGREGFLISEAVRGEGATLHDAAGERFVDELQPRDAVARAIHRLLVETGAPAVFLDMTAIDPARFPNVVEPRCARPGSTPRRSASRSRPRATTSWAASRATSTGARRCRASTRSASARARACTARTGSPPTRCRSASCSAAAPRSRASTSRRRPPRAPAAPAEDDAAPAPSRARRAAMWRARRPGAHRRRACAALLDDPHPLARLVAASRARPARRRRGAHARADFPATRPRAGRPPQRARRRRRRRPRFVKWT